MKRLSLALAVMMLAPAAMAQDATQDPAEEPVQTQELAPPQAPDQPQAPDSETGEVQEPAAPAEPAPPPPPPPPQPEKLANPIAVFAGLDKITGLTTTFEIPIGEERRFGALIVKPNVCYTRPITREPKTTSFVEVDQVEINNTRKPIFLGWMFAESPGLNAVEHAIYDVWLTGCRDPNAPPPVVETLPDLSTLQDEIDKEEKPED
jgi:hypothetical protein